MPVIQGSVNNDELTGSADADIIYALAGDDRVDSGLANDIIYGDIGNDTLLGNGGDDYLFGNEGDDYLDGGDGNDIVIGGAGNDTLSGGLGKDYLLGNEGNDSLLIYSDDTASGGPGVDTFFLDTKGESFTLENSAIVTGFGKGEDVLTLSDSRQLFSQGKTIIDLSTLGTVIKDFSISQGQGIYSQDAIIQDPKTSAYIAILKRVTVLSGATNVAVTNPTTTVTPVSSGSIIALSDTVTTPSIIQGTTNSDYIDISSIKSLKAVTILNSTLTANDSSPNGTPLKIIKVSNPVNGNAILESNQIIFTPKIDHGIGSFIYTVSNGVVTATTTVLVNIPIEQIIGFAGEDTLIGGIEEDSIFGNEGSDSLLGRGSNDTLLGGGGNDQLFGDAGDDLLLGEVGDDTLRGGTGNDTLSGGDGNDVLTGNEGDDSLSGDVGNDRLLGDLGNDTLLGGDGNDFMQGGAGTSGLLGDGNDLLIGGAGEDTLLGDYGNDTLLGGLGNDFLQGGVGVAGISGDGNDSLVGNEGDDTLFGDFGDDSLIGGVGIDVLTGGPGADVFLYNTTLDGGPGERITDFEIGTDIVLLNAANFGFAIQGILPVGNYSSGVNLTIAESGLGSSPGILAANDSLGHVNIFYDANGSTPGGITQLFNIEGISLTALDHNSFKLF